MLSPRLEASVGRLAAEAADRCTRLLHDLVAIPSPSRAERLCCERVQREMEELGYQDVHVDDMGNVLGRLGSGPRVLAYDAHIDTVGISNPSRWRVDPFRGAISDGTLFGRGASDQKGGLAAIVHGVAVAALAGLPEQATLWVAATVQGEDCVGLAWQHLLRETGLRPEAVVIAMPSHLAVCRGQRGRMELELTTSGVSTHGSQPDRGSNAVYAMVPIVDALRRLHGRLAVQHPMLGKGSIAVTGIGSSSPSYTAIPDECTVHVDRRLTIGEHDGQAVAEIESLPEVQAASARVKVLEYAQPSWRGLVLETRKVFPAWETPESSVAFQAALATARRVLGREPRVHRSAFSSSGCVTAGRFDIPTIGFGPADETHAHSVEDQIALAMLVPAMAFYALFPHLYLEMGGQGMSAGGAQPPLSSSSAT